MTPKLGYLAISNPLPNMPTAAQSAGKNKRSAKPNPLSKVPSTHVPPSAGKTSEHNLELHRDVVQSQCAKNNFSSQAATTSEHATNLVASPPRQEGLAPRSQAATLLDTAGQDITGNDQMHPSDAIAVLPEPIQEPVKKKKGPKKTQSLAPAPDARYKLRSRPNKSGDN